MLVKTHSLRNTVLLEWIVVLQTAVSEALTYRKQLCHRPECVNSSIGALISALHAADLYPALETPENMYRSLAWYWEMLFDLGPDL